ncbi:ogr/Delta-like zinc finger family protein [Phytopseudomonas daroniae]|uniref:ogr/Delta-like zinc finger family protein n=1 Tax=Phytopseudomonas daroniae TaxID=2487519 RepID=UPI001FC94C5C|nr:ogr/Delta-like zinc finger family protein [Pseudomonas daroniae]
MNATPKTRTQAQAKRCCPDCGAALIKRSSTSYHPLMSSTYLVCKNPVCGATFTGTDEITHRLSPPSNPNPAIALPYAPSNARRSVLQELGLPMERDQQPAQACLEPATAARRQSSTLHCHTACSTPGHSSLTSQSALARPLASGKHWIV